MATLSLAQVKQGAPAPASSTGNALSLADVKSRNAFGAVNPAMQKMFATGGASTPAVAAPGTTNPVETFFPSSTSIIGDVLTPGSSGKTITQRAGQAVGAGVEVATLPFVAGRVAMGGRALLAARAAKTAGAVAGVAKKIGTVKIIAKEAGIQGSILGSYGGALEAQRPEATPGSIAKESAILGGVGLGLGGVVGGAVAKLGTPKVSDAVRIAEQAKKAKAEVDETVGRIFQGKTTDIPSATRALSDVDTAGVTTYEQLGERVNEKVGALSNKLDELLDAEDVARGTLKAPELVTKTTVGGTTVRQNFVTDAIAQFKELYTKIKDAPALAEIRNIETKLRTEGLTRKEINGLAKRYGIEFGDKAFSKMGEPLTSVNAQAYENTRKGIKEAFRRTIEGKVPQEIDARISDLLNTRKLNKKLVERVNALWQKVKKRGILERAARGVADVVNAATFNTLSGFVSRLLPSNVGLKVMNSIDIEAELAKNLGKLEKLMNTKKGDKGIIDGIIEIIRGSAKGTAVPAVTTKAGQGAGVAKGGQEVSKAANEANVAPEGKSGVSGGVKVTRYTEQPGKPAEVSRETGVTAGKLPTFENLGDRTYGPASLKAEGDFVTLRINTETGKPLGREMVDTSKIRTITINKSEYNAARKNPDAFRKLLAEKLANKSPSQLFGAATGIQEDENGNIKIDPASAALGMLGVGMVTKVRGITTKTLNRIASETKSATVSRQFIEDLTNRPDLKQGERTLMRSVLASFDGATVTVKDFVNKVKAQLLPLKVLDIKISKADTLKKLNGKGIFFEQDMSGEANMVNKKGDIIEFDSLDPATQDLVSKYSGNSETYREMTGNPKYEGVSLPPELRGPVANYKENIYESPISTSAGDTHFPGQTKNYFAHTRVEDLPPAKNAGEMMRPRTGIGAFEAMKEAEKLGKGGTTRRVIELQSDLFQKGNLERELPQSKTGMNFDTAKEVLQQNKDFPARMRVADKTVKELRPRADELARLESYRNTWQERIIREEVAQAAKDGKTKLQFPTGETAMKIEGLGSRENWYVAKEGHVTVLGDKLSEQNLKVGGTIIQQGTGGDSWIITDVLGDGKFKAVPKDRLSKQVENPAMIPDDWKETFDISGKVDTSNPIYRFYEKEVGRYLKNQYGAELHTDPQGVKWWQLNVPKGAGRAPVEAFGAGAIPIAAGQREKE